jgi:hypothetical protein
MRPLPRAVPRKYRHASDTFAILHSFVHECLTVKMAKMQKFIKGI